MSGPMTGLQAIESRAARDRLMVAGAFHPGPGDGLPPDIATLILLAPAEPGYWAHVTASAEWTDGATDPIDRWSTRVIGQLAAELDGRAWFPFGGPPHAPFFAWARRSGRAWASPVTLLVHDVAGLMISYRGAIGLNQRLDLPAPPPCPCDSCETRPCLSACPAGALAGAGYDLAACHAFLDRPEGGDCLGNGCRVRRACPLSQAYGRLPEQSGYHMRLFHR
jgi:hypothetical protein